MPTNFQKAVHGQVKAAVSYVGKQRSVNETVLLKAQCDCTHRDSNNAISLIPPKGGNCARSEFTGNPLYRCSICQSMIDVSGLDEKTVRQAIDVICNLLQSAKLKLDPNREKDEKLRKKISKHLFREQTMVMDVYRMLSKPSKKKKGSSGGIDSIMRIG